VRGRTDVVLDDDPTGVQALHDVPVLLDWSIPRLRRVADAGCSSVHLMTNIRALSPASACEVTREAATAAREALPGCRIVLRGDSTLRGHLAEEYRAVRAAAFPDRAPVLLLVPALPAAGRVTLGGVHWLITDGTHRPLHATEYARDGVFAYRSARLLEWAEERTAGELRAIDGAEVGLQRLRSGGPAAVCEAIIATQASGRPAACAPDAETIADLRTIARGLAMAEARGIDVLVRCAPTFAGVLSGTLAEGTVALPGTGPRSLLVVCGSYVSGTTRQLEHLRRTHGVDAIEPDVRRLASQDPGPEVARVAELASRRLAQRRIALVATPRTRPDDLTDMDAGQQIARGLATIVASVRPHPEALIAKGGITSHVVLRDGLGAVEARVVGPVAPGVALWEVQTGGRRIAYLVFPGNVGGPEHLTRVAELAMNG